MKIFSKANVNIYYILILALIIRFISINQSLWLDEAIGAEAVRDFSYQNIIVQFMRFDNHPPLYYIILKFWTEIFGLSELALRAPSVIFGVLTVFVTYLIARLTNFGKNNFYPIFSALLIATSQFHIYYSQEARMYSMAAFMAVCAIYFYIKTIDGSAGKWFLGFSISIMLLMFTDYAPVFLLPLFWIYAYLKKLSRKWWIEFALSHTILLVFGYFWLPIFLYQTSRGRWLLETLPGWRKVAGGATIKQALLVWMKFVFGRLTYPGKLYYYILVGLSSVPFILSFFKLIFANKPKYYGLLLMWLISPLILGFIASLWFPAFVYFRFLYVLPAFYLLVGWSVSTFRLKSVRNLLVLLLLGVNTFGWVTYITDSNQQREQWRDSVEFLKNNIRENEIVVFEYPEPFTPYRWYAGKNDYALGALDSISASEEGTKEIINKLLFNKTGVYHFDYLRDITDPNRTIEKELVNNGFYIEMEYSQFKGIGKISFWKLK